VSDSRLGVDETAAHVAKDVAALDTAIGHAGKPVVLVWFGLMAATLVSWWLGEGHGATKVAAVGVLVVGFAKVALIGEHFMELRGAPPQLRFAFLGWCSLIPTVLVTIYLAR
jgi:hypothetical protein